MSTYTIIIAMSLVIIISYFFNIISKKTNIPSVLMLITLGVLITIGLNLSGIKMGDLYTQLGVLGNIGLIMIVLEASLDLKLQRDKAKLIFKSITVALLGLLSIVIIIALVIEAFLDITFFNALIFATPLSIMSSAIIIPSVNGLSEKKKEFLIYEGTFSDIFGIMLFYFLLGNADNSSVGSISFNVISDIVIAVLFTIIASYSLIFVFQKIKSEIKLFLLIAVLTLIFAIGKVMHMPSISLLMILVFGLILNNRDIFFRKHLKKHIKEDVISVITKDFKLLTLETAFVVRTFFFVVFGMSIVLSSLLSFKVWIMTILVLAAIYGLRYLLLRLFNGKDFKPELYIAPRGLITILLFFAIPKKYLTVEFESGVLLLTILATAGIMSWALIKNAKKKKQIVINDTENKNIETQEDVNVIDNENEEII
jgi:Kef-type K+ transport system membrane component KefB